MRTIVVNTGTEILLGDVLNTHLTFIAQQILKLALRVDEQRTVRDGRAIEGTLRDVFARADIVFVTGGLGPTTDDVTREIVAELLQLPLLEDPAVRESIGTRLSVRRIPTTKRVWRQAMVPAGGQALINENGTAPGIYLPTNVSDAIASPHLFLLPGPPRELEPMFKQWVMPILQRIANDSRDFALAKFRLAAVGESIVEKKIGSKILAIPEIELGYCARPGEVELRVIGTPASVEKAEQIIQSELSDAIFSTSDETLAEVIVRLLRQRNETLALAESCTGGLLADEVTDVPGASNVFRAGYVVYANEEKIRLLRVSPESIVRFGAVSEQVAIEMAQGARDASGVIHAIATTGIAGPEGGSPEKPVGTVFVAIASEHEETFCRRFFFPSDRPTFKQLVAMNAFDPLRKRLLGQALL
jgi:competence/damage-inducible protein CinA C-terminal domain